MARAFRWLAIFVLWQAGACVIPPPEMTDPPNLPPMLDWTLTSPPNDEEPYSRDTNSPKQFSVEGAVDDPDGDPINTLWYLVDVKGKPFSQYGTMSMVIDSPCSNSLIKDPPEDSYIRVVVVVSDRELKWVKTTNENQPVDTGVDDEGNPYPLIKRVWSLKLKGECPQAAAGR